MRDLAWMEWLIAAAVVAVLAAVVWAYVADSRSPTIELSKAEWTCTAKSTQTVLMPVLVGKVTVMQPRPVTRCDRYERKP